MPLTRPIAEKILVGPDLLSGRLGRRAVMARLHDPTTATLGAIPAVGAMLAEGLASLGIYPDDPTDPTDADLALVAPESVPQLADVAELRGYRSMLGNLDEIDEKSGTDEQDWTKFAEHLRALVADLEARCRALYGYGLAPPAIGSIDLNFAESGDPDDWQVLT